MNSYLEFEIRRSKNVSQPYYWRIIAKKNGEVLAHSETYTTKEACLNAIKLVKVHAATATVWDMTGASPKVAA